MLQELKAALDDAIAALARRPELAAALWERLVAAVVVQPAAGEAAAVPRYDLSYQLNEIEVGGSQVQVLLSQFGMPCKQAFASIAQLAASIAPTLAGEG